MKIMFRMQVLLLALSGALAVIAGDPAQDAEKAVNLLKDFVQANPPQGPASQIFNQKAQELIKLAPALIAELQKQTSQASSSTSSISQTPTLSWQEEWQELLKIPQVYEVHFIYNFTRYRSTLFNYSPPGPILEFKMRVAEMERKLLGMPNASNEPYEAIVKDIKEKLKNGDVQKLDVYSVGVAKFALQAIRDNTITDTEIKDCKGLKGLLDKLCECQVEYRSHEVPGLVAEVSSKVKRCRDQ